MYVFTNVYEPSDDTWLLLESLEKLNGRKYSVCLDLGSGTGIVGIFLLKSNICERVFFVDINEYALENTAYNIAYNNLWSRGIVIGNDSGECFKEHIFDLVVSNPPYLPGVPKDLYDKALLSGPKGFETITNFIDSVSKIIKRGGLFFLVYSSLSNPSVIEEYLSMKGFSIINKSSKHFFFEDIIVAEAVKK
ncbi:MAG: methyltransferase [Staphylothermus sp.]|nr:methyltransferase [Staphylothermus sp.]